MSDLDTLCAALDEKLRAADADLARRYPGERGVRQPVHTVYVPADVYNTDTVAHWGAAARELFDVYAGSAADLATVFELSTEQAEEVHHRVRTKLADEPIEDLRIDFEDGYGDRDDEVEDADAVAAAQSLGSGAATPYSGIRFKSLEASTRRRGLRTLDLFLAETVRQGGVPDGFVLTLPKVTSLDQAAAMVAVCAAMETAHDLSAGTLRFEIQVETPQTILGPDGTALLARMIQAAEGRCTGLHYGTYDYSAACGIAAAYQSMEHPAADHAKAVMQVAAAGTGVHLCDGSTNVLPTGDAANVLAAWRLHHRLVSRSLRRGFYQGWDMHPGQLPTRYVATYAFFRQGLAEAAQRLRAYLHGGDSGYLDEPATVAALAAFVLRGVDCGAIDSAEMEQLVDIDATALAKLARR